MRGLIDNILVMVTTNWKEAVEASNWIRGKMGYDKVRREAQIPMTRISLMRLWGMHIGIMLPRTGISIGPRRVEHESNAMNTGSIIRWG